MDPADREAVRARLRAQLRNRRRERTNPGATLSSAQDTLLRTAADDPAALRLVQAALTDSKGFMRTVNGPEARAKREVWEKGKKRAEGAEPPEGMAESGERGEEEEGGGEEAPPP